MNYSLKKEVVKFKFNLRANGEKLASKISETEVQIIVISRTFLNGGYSIVIRDRIID